MRREKKKSILSLTAEKLYIRREDWGGGGGGWVLYQAHLSRDGSILNQSHFYRWKVFGGGLLQHFYLYCLWNTLSKTSVLNKLGVFFP